MRFEKTIGWGSLLLFCAFGLGSSGWSAAPCPDTKVRIAIMSASAKATGTTPAERMKSTAEDVLAQFKTAPAGAKLFVLPEAILTPLPTEDAKDFGSEKQAREFAYVLPKNGEALTAEPLSQFAEVAKAKQAFLQIGLFEREGDRVYNTAIIIGPDGKLVTKHRKVNLYISEATETKKVGEDGDESKYITRGPHHATRFDGSAVGLGEVGVAICADIYEGKGQPHLMEKFRDATPGINLMALSVDWQEAADSSEGPTKGWGPSKFIRETTTYLNSPVGISSAQRFEKADGRKPRKDREIYVAASNTDKPAPGAGILGPDGEPKAWVKTGPGWASACVPKITPNGNAPAPKPNH